MQSHFLNLPYQMPGQNLKYLTSNTQLKALDSLLFCSVTDVAATTLPTDAPNGTRILIAAEPDPNLENQASVIAIYINEYWEFYQPSEGWQVWSLPDSEFYIFEGETWTVKSTAFDLGAYNGRLENLEALGIGTAPDANTIFSVKGNQSLLDGFGSHRLTINRHDITDTASIIFQTSYSGRAEIGLTDEDGLSIRTSSDGQNWKNGPKIHSSGSLSAPAFLSDIIEISRDSVTEIQPVKDHGIIAFTLKWGNFPQATCAGLLSFDIGTSPLLVTLSLGPKAHNLGTADMTGTSGPDDALSVSVREGVIQFENRINTTVQVSYSVIV